MNKNLAMVIGAGAALVLGAHLALSATSNVGASPEAKLVTKEKKPTAHIVFEKKNTVALRTPFTDSFVDDLKSQLIAVSNALPAGEPIYLYLSTPGGSISAGESLIDTIAGLPNPVYTVVSFAASMGFLTTEAVQGTRYILPSGTLMAHRAFMGVEGQVPGQFDERARFNEEDIRAIETGAAARLGLTHAEYSDKIKNEYWVTGERAVAAGAADQVATATCSSDLSGTHTQNMDTVFGPVAIEWENCPLISSPVSIHLASVSLLANDIDLQNANKLVNTLRTALANPRNMIDNVTLQNAFVSNVK
jgi:ATP-dependent Clp protease, protease subunit